ncbi:MAG: hypothetical protein RBR71_13795 [Gudongella sp.]|nr:hypothetical protein [Gudongella sp.]
MKRILAVGGMILVLILLLGCSVQEDNDYGLIKEGLDYTQISGIEIGTDVYKKNVTNRNDIEIIASLINDIQIYNNSFEDPKNIEEYDIICFKVYNSEGNINTSLSISKDIAFYENKWVSIDKESYDRVIYFYENADYEELRDPLLLEAKQKRIDRKEKPISEALKGTWISETGSLIKFDENYLYQGSQYEYLFDYNIKKTDDKAMEVSIYGTKGIFVKGRELSILDIKMDETKTCMVMKKTMTGGSTCNDKFIYVDGDNITLGSFDEYFFYKYGGY